MNTVIRQESQSDVAAIRAVTVAAFLGAPHTEALAASPCRVPCASCGSGVLPGVPPEYFQALPSGASVPHGVVTYHAAFNEPVLSVTQEIKEPRS